MLGLDAIGFTSCEPLEDARRRIKDMDIGRDIDSRYPDDFWMPGLLLKNAKTVIIAAECYLTSEPVPESTPGVPLGTIARYTWRNYYRDTKDKLRRLALYMKKEAGAHCVWHSNGPIAEKPLAERAGIGWYGKNCIIRNDKLGSWMVLGELITDVGFETDEITDSVGRNGSCGSCKACIDACPTGALYEPYRLDKSKCFQHLTNWYGIFPDEFRPLWEKRLYGCTNCQDACPRNMNIRPKERIPKFGQIGSVYPLLEILNMSRDEYFYKFRGNQMGASWINFSSIRRNAVVALGNIADETTANQLIRLLADKDNIIRAHTAWSLSRFSGSNTKMVLKKMAIDEKDHTVRTEIEKALAYI